MTDDLPTPTQVALRLAQISRLLDAAKDELETADEKAVKARARYEVTEDEAFLNADASNAETKKRIARLAAKDERLDAEIAAVQAKAIRTRIDILKTQVDIGRSLNAAVRAEWAAS